MDTQEEKINEFKHDCLVRFMLEQMEELSTVQLVALADRALFIVQDRGMTVDENIKRESKGT
jgi:hypothetical protein